PTTFNFLGPLANPAGATRRTVGVSDPTMAERMIGALAELGAEHALVFYGHDGLDELTTTTTSTVFELRGGSLSPSDRHPGALRRSAADPPSRGPPGAERSALAGGDIAGNAQAVPRVLGGQAGPLRDIAALNAAAAIVVAGLADDLAGGLALAGAALDDGRAA